MSQLRSRLRVFASKSLNLCTHSIKELNIWSNKSHEGVNVPALFKRLVRTAGFCADAPSSKVTESHLALLNPVGRCHRLDFHLPVFRCIFQRIALEMGDGIADIPKRII